MTCVNERPSWTGHRPHFASVLGFKYYILLYWPVVGKNILTPPTVVVSNRSIGQSTILVFCFGIQRRNKTCKFRHPDNQCPEIYRICGKLSSKTLQSTEPKLSQRPIHSPLLHQESWDEKIWVTGHKNLHHFIEGKWVDVELTVL